MHKNVEKVQKTVPASFERSVVARRTFADEHVEFWGEVYLANPFVRDAGVLFETFLLAPVEILLALAQRRGAPGLLPAQRLVRAGIERTIVRESALDAWDAIAALDGDGMHCANGRWIEKLKHHAWPRKSRYRGYTLKEM